eukprot:Ihof_evm5s531 gene=Ihof_evmTU5s531
MSFRVYYIKSTWHGNDPIARGLGTPPTPPEHDKEFFHFCRHCRNRTMGLDGESLRR